MTSLSAAQPLVELNSYYACSEEPNCTTAGEGRSERKDGSDRGRGKRGAHLAYESKEEWSG